MAWKTRQNRNTVGVVDGEELLNLVEMTGEIPPTAWEVMEITYIQAHHIIKCCCCHELDISASEYLLLLYMVPMMLPTSAFLNMAWS